MGDHAFLRVMRITIVCFACIVLGFALWSNASIFKMVENAYKVTLAGAFVPLFFGAFWKRATTQGALCCHLRRPDLLDSGRAAGRRSQPGATTTDRSLRLDIRHGARLVTAAMGWPFDAASRSACRAASHGRRRDTPRHQQTPPVLEHRGHCTRRTGLR
jgi:hypothetical protein